MLTAAIRCMQRVSHVFRRRTAESVQHGPIYSIRQISTSFAVNSRSTAVCAASETAEGPQGPAGVGRLQQALQEAAAVTGTTAADFCNSLHHIEALQKLQGTLGGLIWLVSCGRYLEGHPQAGQTAYALLHVVPLTISEAPAGSSSPYQHKGLPLVISPLADSSLTPDWVFFPNAYELQPTGTLSGVHDRALAVQFPPCTQQYSAVPYVMPASAAATCGCDTACIVAHSSGGKQLHAICRSSWPHASQSPHVPKLGATCGPCVYACPTLQCFHMS
jgi:hypothetical protein